MSNTTPLNQSNDDVTNLNLNSPPLANYNTPAVNQQQGSSPFISPITTVNQDPNDSLFISSPASPPVTQHNTSQPVIRRQSPRRNASSTASSPVTQHNTSQPVIWHSPRRNSSSSSTQQHDSPSSFTQQHNSSSSSLNSIDTSEYRPDEDAIVNVDRSLEKT